MNDEDFSGHWEKTIKKILLSSRGIKEKIASEMALFPGQG
jgi:hypothetical protein